MVESDTLSYFAISMSIIAILVAGIIASSVFLFPKNTNQDITGINMNTKLIDLLQDDLEDMNVDVKYLLENYMDSSNIDEDNLEDLEDDINKEIKKLDNRIDDLEDAPTSSDGEDGTNGIDGKDWSDMSEDEYNCIVDNRWIYSDTMECLNLL